MPRGSTIRRKALQIRTLIFAFLITALAPVAAQAQDSRRCLVSGLEGDGAQFEIGGHGSPLGLGSLPKGTEAITTGADTRLEITCLDGLVLTVGPDTRIMLGELQGMTGPESSLVMELLRGIVGVVAPYRNWDVFEIRTPVAIASVRSTEWLVGHNAVTGTSVYVRKGRVAVGSPSTDLELDEGEGVALAGTRSVGTVPDWDSRRLVAAQNALGFGWK